MKKVQPLPPVEERSASDPLHFQMPMSIVVASMAFGSGEADFGDSGSVTVASCSAQQQAGIIAVASSSIKRRVIMPRRSKRVPKGLCDQAMTNPDSSAGRRTKDMDNSTERGVTRKRNAEDS